MSIRHLFGRHSFGRHWFGRSPFGSRLSRSSRSDRVARVSHCAALVPALLVGLPVATALAGSHTWDVNEVFSDETGTIQFIELREANGTPNEVGVPGHNMTSDTKNFTIPGSPLASPTSNKLFLMGTAAFAALPGAPTPDAIIPEGVLPFFFSPAGDTVTYVPWDSLTFASVPTDGINSLNADLTTGPNSPTNYAGESGSVDASPPPPPGTPAPALSPWGLLVFGALLAAAGARYAMRRPVSR